MKKIVLAAFLLCAFSPRAFAAFCSAAPPNTPCTPDPGRTTDDAKDAIVKYINLAQALETDVQSLKQAYIDAKNSGASDEEKLEACRKYFGVVAAQEDYYQQAAQRASDLYHVGSKERRLTIAKPRAPEDAYVEGLSALWNPRITESGPSVKFAAKIVDKDGVAHYSGATKMDPRVPEGPKAFTLADGRVLVLKDTFAMALERTNPAGFLAGIVNHEARHFDRLSWTDAQGRRRGWQRNDAEERDAYKRDRRYARTFGLEQRDIDEIDRNIADYSAAAAAPPDPAKQLTPADAAKWKAYYENTQLNLEEDFAALSAKVKAEKDRQAELARRLEEERIAREKEAEERRIAQEQAEAARKQREAEERRDYIAAYCGYTAAFQGNTGKFLGFKRPNEYLFFAEPYYTPIYMNDLEVFMLVARVCFEVEGQSTLPAPISCNRGGEILAERAASPGFEAKLDYMFGHRANRRPCVNYFFDNAASMPDVASFERAVVKYHKDLIKERRERDRNWRAPEPERKRPQREPRSPRSGNDEHKGPNHDEVWRRVNPIIR